MMINDLMNIFSQSTEFHLLAALLLGILVAVNPCQIAISLSALTALADKNHDSKVFMEKSVVFALGRMSLYLLLGSTLYLLFKIVGLNVKEFYSQNIAVIVEDCMPFIVAAFGVFFLIRALNKHHHNDNCHNSGSLIKKNKRSGVFFLGFILAFLFCPESAVLFFGMTLPLSIISKFGLLLLLLFSIAAVVPILLIAYACKFSMEKAVQWEIKLERVQYVINLVSSVLLILIAVILFCVN